MIFDPECLDAILTVPAIDGRFDGRLADFALHKGQRRPLVLFAFAPRSAGTFLRTAAIGAMNGQLARLVHAEGGRDAALYLPWVIAYFQGGVSADTVVTHVHMQASSANRHFLDAFDLRPIIMVRSIPDMLSSLWSMIEEDPEVPLGFSFQLPPGFAAMAQDRKSDVMVDLMAPWYTQYFAGWKAYAEEVPDRVCVLRYTDFCDDPAETLETALAHARVPASYLACEEAIATTWLSRGAFRCNRGSPNRVVHRFSDEQLARIDRMVSHYSQLAAWRAELLAVSSAQ